MAAEILVVDDSETVRTMVRNILEKAGYNVSEAENGREALVKLNERNSTNLILCDVNMPEMDGITMCREVHGNTELNRIPIVMLTTEANPDLKAAGKSYGVVAWIIKPVVERNLVLAVSKIIGGSK